MIPKFRAWLKKEQKMDNYIDHSLFIVKQESM